MASQNSLVRSQGGVKITMAMVQPKSQKLRLFTTHLLLLNFYRGDYVSAADGYRHLAARG